MEKMNTVAHGDMSESPPVGWLGPGRMLQAGFLTLIVVAGFGVSSATSWVDRPFPGFLVLANGVVASATVDGWPATADGSIYQHEVVSVDGQPVREPGDVYAIVSQSPVGTPLTYRFRRDRAEFERTIETQLFGQRDALLLFGLYFLNGLALAIAAVVVHVWGRGSDGARSTVPFLMIAALWGLSAMDLYGPYLLFRLHALCESLLFAAAVQMAIGFPHALGTPPMRRRIVACAYGLAATIGLVYQYGLPNPSAYVTWHLIATCAGGIALLAFVLSQLGRFMASRFARRIEPTPTVLIGTLVALLLPISLTISEPLTGGASAQSAVGFSMFVFPLSIVYATTRQRLFR